MAAAQQSRIKPIFYDIAEQGDPRGPQPVTSSAAAHERSWQETNFTHIPDPEKTRIPGQNLPQTNLPIRSGFDQAVYCEPPPAYTANDAAVPYDTTSDRELPPSADQSSARNRPAPRNDGQLPLPVVIPQTTKAFKGAFYSPFVRAYVPELQMHGISESEFLTVLDGLNECWVANPVFEGVGLAGTIMQQFYGVHIVQLVGIGVQSAAGLGSAATSFARTRAYVKAVNADFFHPAGLNLGVKTTKKMMEEVEFPAKRLELPPLEDESEIDDTAVREEATQENTQISPNDTRMRRIRALEGYVMPLNFDVPAASTPDNLLKRMGNAQAQRMAKRQQKKDDKRLEKTISKEEKRAKDSKKDGKDRDKEIAKIDKELEKKHGEMLKKLDSRKAQKEKKERRKIEKDWDKECRKLHKEREKELSKQERKSHKRERKAEKKSDKPSKEEKKTQKIRWLVITRWSGDENSEGSTADDDDDDSSSLEEHEHKH